MAMELLLNDVKLLPGLFHNKPCAESCTAVFGAKIEHSHHADDVIHLDRVGWISYIVNVYINSVLCIFGFSGIFLILWVLYKDKSRSSNNVFLQSLAVFDIFILIYTVFYTILRSIYPATGHMANYYSLSPYIIAIVLPLAWIAQTGTIWFTTLVAGDRYFAITYPFKAASFCTHRRAVKVAVVASSAAVLFNLPRFAHYYVIGKNMVRTNASTVTFVAHIKVDLPGWNENVYHYVYHVALTSIFLYTVPLTLLTFFNCKLIATLRKARKNLAAMGGSKSASLYRKNNSITLNMIIVISKFIVCQTPDFIAAIIGALQVTVISDAYLIFLIFKELLLVINSTMNFYIYVIFNAKFRKIMAKTCCRKKEQRNVTKIETLSMCNTRLSSSNVLTISRDGENSRAETSKSAFYVSPKDDSVTSIYANRAIDSNIAVPSRMIVSPTK